MRNTGIARPGRRFHDGDRANNTTPHLKMNNDWIPVYERTPDTPRCVLATDYEFHVIASYEDGKWINTWTEEEIDSVIQAWMELPPIEIL
jgi:hypothetical protein